MIRYKFLSLLLACLFFYAGLEAQIRNVKVNSDTVAGYPPCEVAIAINPVDPYKLAAGAVLDFLYLSSDGGNTWHQLSMNSEYGVYGDPSLIYDKWGNLYYSHLSSPPSNIGYWIDRIVVQKSTNNGIVWSGETGLGYAPPLKNQDKEWISADWTNSQHMGNLYVAWTQFDQYASSNSSDSTQILLASFDYSSSKWNLPVRVSDQGGDCIDDDNTVEGAVPAVGPNGEVYLSWAGPKGIMFDKSTNGGLAWGKDVFVDAQPGGWAMSVSGVPRCNGLPITAADISNSEYRGNIYINWADQRNGLTNPDIFIAKSTDGGVTWSEAIRVNNDNTQRPQFFPWMSVDPKTGFIYIVFYDRRNTTEKETEVYLARSKNGGESFENFKISESSFDFPDGFRLFFGDYNNITAYDGKIYPIWTRIEVGDPEDASDDNLSIMVAPISDDELITDIKNEKAIIDEYRLFNNFPNPFNPSTNISYMIPERSLVSLIVYDVVGRKVAVLENEYKSPGFYEVRFNGEDLSSGTYIYKLKAGSFSANGKMLLLK